MNPRQSKLTDQQQLMLKVLAPADGFTWKYTDTVASLMTQERSPLGPLTDMADVRRVGRQLLRRGLVEKARGNPGEPRMWRITDFGRTKLERIEV